MWKRQENVIMIKMYDENDENDENVTWSMLLTSLMELNWVEEGVDKTRECNHDKAVQEK